VKVLRRPRQGGNPAGRRSGRRIRQAAGLAGPGPSRRAV